MELETVKNAMSRDLDWANATEVVLAEFITSGTIVIRGISFTCPKAGLFIFNRNFVNINSLPAGMPASFHIKVNAQNIVTGEVMYTTVVYSSSAPVPRALNLLSLNKEIFPVKDGDIVSSDASWSNPTLVSECLATQTWTFVPYKEE